jgi:hypothetical protein
MRKVGPNIAVSRVSRVSRVAGVALAACLAVAGTAVGAGVANGAAGGTDESSAMTLAVYGDAPYGTSPTDSSQTLATPAFVDAVNDDPDVSSVIHVGDIHSGSQFCTAAYDQTVAGLWTRYQDPLVYTPGDNEWADCHKAKEGGHVRDGGGNPVDYADGNPAANLGLVRSLFFPHAGQTLGGGNLRVQSQAQHADPAHPGDAAYVENVMWSRKGVLFVTLNIPGGSNNDTDPWYGAAETTQEKAQQAAEVAARTGADRRWLAAAFQRAEGDGDRAMVIVTQADMWDPENGAAHLTSYEPFIGDIAAGTTAFGKPVLLFNGDSHVYRSDDPLVLGAPCVTEASPADPADPTATRDCPVDDATMHPGYDVPNFHRVVVHGSTFPLEWLKLTVHPSGHQASGPASDSTFGPFSWTREPQVG